MGKFTTEPQTLVNALKDRFSMDMSVQCFVNTQDNSTMRQYKSALVLQARTGMVKCVSTAMEARLG